MRLSKLAIALCVTFITLATIQAETTPTKSEDDGRVTLLGTLEEWKYPDSKMPGGATMSDGGFPGEYSIHCQTVMTTPDSFEGVVKFYAKQFGRTDAKVNDAQSDKPMAMLAQDDSKDRPVKVQVLLINRPKTSTTLTISRAENEKETHIAWAHFMHFDVKQ